MKSPQSSFQCPYMKQDTMHKNLRATWRYPVSCVKGRLRYSLCSVCMNQTEERYPLEYTPHLSYENGWAEPDRHGRITSNLKPSLNQARTENHKKEGALLCFGTETNL